MLCDAAIRRHVLDHGRPPAKLANLVPRYLSGVPRNPFSDDSLVYRLTDDGHMLYSAGKNGVDDGGPRRFPRTRTTSRSPISI